MSHSKQKKVTYKARPKKMSAALSDKEELYEKDFFRWTKAQAALLTKGDLKNLDLENLKEEIESLGKSDKRALPRFHHPFITFVKEKISAQTRKCFLGKFH